MSSATAPRRSRQPLELSATWRERAAGLFVELRRPASAMVRRAFGSTFADDEIEDIYANAWVGTLRALERRHTGLGDEEIRKYVLTAVAHQASKELRRRRRKPVAPIERAAAIPDARSRPEERADQAEDSRITRDLLASLPKRRRAVLMLRYGWGLEPAQVCELIEGLSPRAYRKEVTKGIDQLADRVRVLERGEWCADREPILKAFAAGIADAEQQHQAQLHLAHCRHCADFVGKLTGHLHDLGGSLVASGVLDLAADGRLSLPDRIAEIADRTRDALSGGPPLAAAAPRGAGAAGAGLLAKLGGLGAAGKATLACLGGGATAAACVAAGIGPGDLGTEHRPAAGSAPPAEARLSSEPFPKPVAPALEEIAQEPVVVSASEPPVSPPVLESPPAEAPPTEPTSPPPSPAPAAAAQQFEPVPATATTSGDETPEMRATTTGASSEFGP